MRRREFCRQVVLTGGAMVLAPLVKGCAPDLDPALTADSPFSVPSHPTDGAPSVTTEGTTAVATPHPTRSPLPTSTPDADPTRTAEPTSHVPDQTAQPSPTAVAPQAVVALVKTADRAFGVRQAIELLGLNPARGNRVLLKPNYNSADPAPASTHPDTLRSLITALHEMGARSITVGERSGMGATRDVLTQTGVMNLAEELGFETAVFDELEEQAWVVQQSGDFHWRSGFAVPRMLLDSSCVVQTCNLKTHRYGGHFTLSLKNSVGFVARTTGPHGYNYMDELHSSPYQRQLIAEINSVYSPALIVMDGVDAFVDGGPASGKQVSPSVVIAGTDRIAIDAVGVAILRLFGTTPEVSRGSVFAQAQIARAVELNLGIDAPERISIVTGNAESAAYANTIRPYL